MKKTVATKILFLRHAPIRDAGRLHGRSDADADCTTVTPQSGFTLAGQGIDHIVTSPARRCVQTVHALWPEGLQSDAAKPGISTDPRLWEQDFGDWEGRPHTALPDLGPMPGDTLARHAPPNGESFMDVCARVRPALAGMVAGHGGQTLFVCAHAGSIRAALAVALGLSGGQALKFQIAPLSLTVLTHFEDDLWAAAQVGARGLTVSGIS